MEKSEPALVPEWLRCTGNVTRSGTLAHHSSSSFNSDVSSSTPATRQRYSRSISDKDSHHSAILDRTNSGRNSSINGSTKHPYSSFTRSHRDKNREKEKDKLVIGNLWDYDEHEPLEKNFSSRVDRSSFKRSQSLASRKFDSKNGHIGNGVLSGDVGSGIQKAVFEKDFPSLRNEEKKRVLDVGRISSPGLSTAVQSLPIGNSGLAAGERWTSALAEVPPSICTASVGHLSAQQGVVSNQLFGISSPAAGLNMAEALSQAPLLTRNTPQLPDKSQRLEELAIKQSRQLIPMTPPMPKALVLNPDKSKQAKTAGRTSETTLATKSLQQQHHSSTQLTSQSSHGLQVRPDAPKTSHVGKFLVLKPVWENGVCSTAKDTSSNPTNNVNSRLPNGQPAVATALTSLNNSKLLPLEQKIASVALNPRPTGEKRPSLAHAQSRSDFFNLMRKKTTPNSSVIPQHPIPAVSSASVKKYDVATKEAATAPLSHHPTENDSKITGNGDTFPKGKRSSEIGEKSLCLDEALYPDEEEAAFLRSLGWDENAGEDEGLTEEEINAFYQEYMKLRPSLKVCRGAQQSWSMLSESRASTSGGASSELASSDSESED